MMNKTLAEYDGTVLNLYTGEFLYYGKDLDPKVAVVCAYAQDKGDWSTWDYEKYYPLVKESEYCYVIGNFSTFKRSTNEK